MCPQTLDSMQKGGRNLQEDHEEVPGQVALAVVLNIQAARIGPRPKRLLVKPAVADLWTPPIVRLIGAR